MLKGCSVKLTNRMLFAAMSLLLVSWLVAAWAVLCVMNEAP